MLLPAAARMLTDIKAGDVRLDVQQRGAIQHVDILNMDDVTCDAPQSYQAQPDGIRPPRSTSGKHAAGNVVQIGFHDEPYVPSLMKMIDQMNMGKAIKIAEAFRVLIKDLYRSLYPLSINGLYGRLVPLFVGAVYDANWQEKHTLLKRSSFSISTLPF